MQQTGLPRVVIHAAVSADGRIDWITPDLGQFYGLVAVWNEDATLAGSETILRMPGDIPPEDASAFAPTVHTPGDTRPILVVADSRGRVRTWHALKSAGYWRRFAALVTRTTPPDYLEYLRDRHIDVVIAGEDRIDFRDALRNLRLRYGAMTVRVDSGGTLNGVLLREGLVDEVSVLFQPVLVGGESPKSFFRAPDLASPEGVIPLKLLDVQKLEGDVVWVRYALP